MQLLNQGYKPQFTGHETFPLRYGWLKKVFDAIAETENAGDNKSIFRDEGAMARFGVGKNMVASMRHWGNSTGVIEEIHGFNTISTTNFGQLFFGRKGVDPFMERSATLWLLHWHLVRKPRKTTWYWSFNVFAGITFERETLVKGLEKLSTEQGWTRVSNQTIKRDVECFIRTYVARNFLDEAKYEDVLESPLTELGLIQSIGRRDGFQFIRGPKNSLGDGILGSAIVDFWSEFQDSNSLSFESVLYEPSSPGRVFLLNEESLAERLTNIEEITTGEIRWSETAGMRQLIRRKEFSDGLASKLIKSEFEKSTLQQQI